MNTKKLYIRPLFRQHLLKVKNSMLAGSNAGSNIGRNENGTEDVDCAKRVSFSFDDSDE